MTATFNEHEFEKKLHLLKDSQESIQSLSAWCLQHKQHHKKIVASWLSVLKKVQIDQRLSLFYLANDVIQYSKRKNYDFVKSWSTALQRATPMVREERVKNRILRIFKIWSERGVYDEIFISDLSGLLSTNTKKTTPEVVILDPNDFQPSLLINKIKEFEKVESDTDLKLKNINDCKLQLSDADALRSHLKDRRKGDDVVGEVDEGIERMQAYIKALQVEIKERTSFLEILDHAVKFYTTQKGEAKMVANAYRSFGVRVKGLKRKLDELIPTLRDTTPVPSPDINAPSPSPDSDLDLPDDLQGLIGSSISTISTVNSVPPAYYPLQELANQSAAVAASANIQIGESPPAMTNDNCFSSFMGTGGLPFDIRKTLFGNDLISTPPPPPPLITSSNTKESSQDSSSYDPEQGNPIEVIDSRPKVSLFDETFKIPPFILENLKNLIPPGPPAPETSPPAAPAIQTPSPDISYSTQTSFDYGQSTPESSIRSTPLPPPPLPPSMFLEQNFEPSSSNLDHGTTEDEWNTKLPPKFPTWTGDWENDKRPASSTEWMTSAVSDTPESPPHYEKEGVEAPIEYDDAAAGDVEHRTLVVMPYGGDTDHRTMARPQRLKDIDHRNLITLTASPQSSSPLPPPPTPSIWKSQEKDFSSSNPPKKSDADYRTKPELVPLPMVNQPVKETKQITIPSLLKSPDQHDNIESVDMEMSDDEEERKAHSSKIPVTPQSPDAPIKIVANRNLSPRKIPILSMTPTENNPNSVLLNGNSTEPSTPMETIPTPWQPENHLALGNGTWTSPNPNPMRNGNRGNRGGNGWPNRQFSPRGIIFKQQRPQRGHVWRPSQVQGLIARGVQMQQQHHQVQGLVPLPPGQAATGIPGTPVAGLLQTPTGQRFFRPRMQFTGQPRHMRGGRGRW